MKSFAEKVQIVPLRAPAVSTASWNSALVRMRNVQWLSFLVQWGAMAGAATNTYTIRAYSAATNTTGAGDTPLPFTYRLSSAVGADSWGAISSAAANTTDCAVLGSQQNRLLLIEIDPAVIPGLHSAGRYVYLECTAGGTAATDANYAMSVVGLMAPRYPQNANLGST